jgi:hypothetical protein
MYLVTSIDVLVLRVGWKQISIELVVISNAVISGYSEKK